MDIILENIAKIRSAKIICQGLTAIIGDNNTGKSTVGKVLYSVFHTFRNLKDGFFNARAGYVLQSLNLPNVAATRRFFRPEWFQPDKSMDDEEVKWRYDFLLRRKLRGPHLGDAFRKGRSSKANSDRELFEDLKRQIRKVREIAEPNLLHDAIDSDLKRYFKNQFLPNYLDFTGKSSITIRFRGGTISGCWNPSSMLAEDALRNEAWFLGTPLILDVLGEPLRPGALAVADPINKELVSRLRRYRPGNSIAKRVADVELAPVLEKIGGCFSGDFSVGKEGELVVALAGMETPLNSANLSMGVKMFALLRLMLEANLLKRKDVLVLDEPENHLHPEFQVILADAIVALQRIYELTVLVTTHSPYFLQALELAARRQKAKTGVGETLAVYQPTVVDKLGRVDFEPISGDVSSMYRKFARTMRDLELERGEVEIMEKETADVGSEK